MVQELNLQKDQARYDPNMEPHVHLVCTKCKNIIDWMDPMISKNVERVSNEADFSTGRWNLDIFGICRSCGRRTVKQQA